MGAVTDLLPPGCGRIVAVDTESSGLHPDDGARLSVISLAWEANDGQIEAIALPFDQGLGDKVPNQTISLFDQDPNLGGVAWCEVLEWLSQQRLVMFNAKHDLHILQAGTRQWPGADLAHALAWDCMIAEWVMEPGQSVSLQNTAQRHVGEGKGDAPLKEWLRKHAPKGMRNRYDLVPWEIMESYARIDAELTLRVFLAQQHKLDQGLGHLLPIIDREHQVLRVLLAMERRGIGYDIESSKAAANKARQVAIGLEMALPFTPTPAGARRWFFEKHGAIPHCVTDKGGIPSVGECCVRSLIAQNIDGAADWAAYQKVTHAIEKYYDGMADKCGDDGRLRTDFRQHGTISMRFSSTRVNLQALPHDYRLDIPQLENIPSPRSMFRASKGHELWELDLAQAELRAATSIARCKRMRELLESGADVHAATAEALFGTSDFEHRQVSKRCNFGLIYNIGPDTFRHDVEKHTGVVLSRNSAERVVSDWRELYPEFGQVNRRAERTAYKRGYVRLVSGRLRWFGPGEEYHKAFNAVIQGGIAEFMKQWMIQTEQQHPGSLLLQVHDSLVLEVPDTQAEATTVGVAIAGAELATRLFKILMLVDRKAWR